MRAAPVARPYVSSLGAPPIEDIHNAIPPLSPPSGARIERLDRKRDLGEGGIGSQKGRSLRRPRKEQKREFVCSFVGWVGGLTSFSF